MKLSILTEGFSHTGYGHIIRCMAIARKFSQFHVSVSFIVYGDANVSSLLSDFSVENVAWQENVESLSVKLKNIDILLIDSYLAPRKVYYFLQSVVPFCIYLDDFNRLDYPPGIVINGTVGAEKLPYDKGNEHIYFLGKDYVILRDEFRDVIGEKVIYPEISSVLVTFGGTDPLNITPRVLRILVETFPKWQKNIVLGAAFEDYGTIKTLADRQTRIYSNVDAIKMGNLMLSSDIAISASGQTINELAAVGLPSVLFKVASNQANNIAGWKNYGFVDTYIDATTGWKDSDLLDALYALFPESKRRRLSMCGRTMMDAQGVERIVRRSLFCFVFKYLQIQEAQESDARALFELVNDPLVRQNSFSSDLISWDEHISWFHNSVLLNKYCVLYVIRLKENILAQIRFNATNKNWENSIVSISIAAPFRGWGIASTLLQKAIRQLHSDNGCRQFYAYIKSNNKASYKAFEKAGFKAVKSDRSDALKYLYIYEE